MDISKKNSRYSHIKGMCLVVLGFLCASCLSALCKSVIHKLPLSMILFTQNAIALSLYFLFSLPSLKGSFQTRRIPLHFFRALTGVASYICLFLAIEHIPLVNATLLANSTPLFLPFVIFLWFHQKIGLGLWICILIGFVGVFFIVNPMSEISSLFSSYFIIAALVGSIFSAIALQTIHYLAKTEKTTTINLYYFAFSSLLTLPWALIEWSPLENIPWLILIGMGVFLLFTQLFLAKAYQYASPTLLGPFNYSIVIFTGILGWIFWAETPTLTSGIGLLLICVGGILSMTKVVKGSV